jgi:hypothetical protein
MANEIYNTTYWGDALKTAISLNDKPELFGSQFDLKDRVETESATLEAELCLSNNIHKIANL